MTASSGIHSISAILVPLGIVIISSLTLRILSEIPTPSGLTTALATMHILLSCLMFSIIQVQLDATCGTLPVISISLCGSTCSVASKTMLTLQISGLSTLSLSSFHLLEYQYQWVISLMVGGASNDLGIVTLKICNSLFHGQLQI